MTSELTTDEVWREIEKNLFAVIGMVTAKEEARTVGIVYVVWKKRLYIVTGRDTWKAKHIDRNPHISVTIPITKQIPIVPWVKIPAATITFNGRARLMETSEIPEMLLHKLLRGLEVDQELMDDSCVLEITPEKDFVTYGVGVSLLTMRHPEKAGGRVPVSQEDREIALQP